jgi:acetoacetyl-CoA synthetase
MFAAGQREPISEGTLLWTPSPERVAQAHLTRFAHWLRRERGLAFPDFASLWQWSVSEIEAFWQAIWDYFDVRASSPPECVLASRAMPGAQWFPGARLNYAEHILRHERAGETRPSR